MSHPEKQVWELKILIFGKKEMQKKAFNEVADELTKIGYRDEMRKFLSELLSEEEEEDLGKRWLIGKMLAEGISKREVARKLGTARGTVDRWEGVWKLHNGRKRGRKEKVGAKKSEVKKTVCQKKAPVKKSVAAKMAIKKEGVIDLSKMI